MNYHIDLSDIAIEDLNGLPRPVRKFTIAQLESLGEDPALLSVPTHYPYPPNCQIFLFDFDSGEERWYVCILFRYSQDERSLEIIGIGRTNGPID